MKADIIKGWTYRTPFFSGDLQLKVIEDGYLSVHTFFLCITILKTRRKKFCRTLCFHGIHHGHTGRAFLCFNMFWVFAAHALTEIGADVFCICRCFVSLHALSWAVLSSLSSCIWRNGTNLHTLAARWRSEGAALMSSLYFIHNTKSGVVEPIFLLGPYTVCLLSTRASARHKHQPRRYRHNEAGLWKQSTTAITLVINGLWRYPSILLFTSPVRKLWLWVHLVHLMKRLSGMTT